ncbi:50S ribosomal protein L21 [Dichotomicrobium thermohalophilum]|uniref:Large ribosomal subunit protein bL21 n=1 Tax=Dichotomicrobium thermohalophilum TaxID=933063 RepID=A0A397PI12_9HYPH|nr:50S ribosomal protein L21 [Dichotomicrobium thermohalophilum]RIA47509.1 LSU ribosomal protein L21P [Dichotomicrobium thermohalophilum]
MYAVIRTGGKQYRVAPNDVLEIEKVEADEGEVIELPEVLMIGKDGAAPQIGAPTIDGARVAAEVLEQGRGEKIIVFKKKRRKNYRRKRGHRQPLTTIRVLEVLEAGQKPGEGVGSAPAKETKGKGKAKKGTEQAPAAGAAEESKAQKKASGKQKPAAPSGFEKLDAPQGEPDNLKALPGVGPKLAEKLNEYGIFHFHQLAAMSEADVEEMDAALNLRGRATRDDWVGQAKQFIEDSSA